LLPIGVTHIAAPLTLPRGKSRSEAGAVDPDAVFPIRSFGTERDQLAIARGGSCRH
jgi:hypothetical protein